MRIIGIEVAGGVFCDGVRRRQSNEKRPHERLAIPVASFQRLPITACPKTVFPFLANLLALIPCCFTRLRVVLLLRPFK